MAPVVYRRLGEPHYIDTETDQVIEVPPTQNVWSEVFDAVDVRLILCYFMQINDEAAAKDIEIRWTIDGTAYLGTRAADNVSPYWAFKDYTPSAGATTGIATSLTPVNAGFYTDYRGVTFKVEVRMTSVVGTNQELHCLCKKETW